jgi:hypothetical protein
MRKSFTIILVTVVMVIGLLGITNPGFKQPYRLFDNSEGKLTHNFYIFSVYQLHEGYIENDNKKYRLYKRYIGMALTYFEISPLKVEQE